MCPTELSSASMPQSFADQTTAAAADGGIILLDELSRTESLPRLDTVREVAGRALPQSDPYRHVSTLVLADNVAAHVEQRRGSAKIATLFAEKLHIHSIAVLPETLREWGDEFAGLVTTDPVLDSELEMAQRAARAVLLENLGTSALVRGPWLEREARTINGEEHLLTGQPCPNCETHPECARQSRHYCPNCGWEDYPF